ncbi:MAG TPA: branched-chain amino acid ABC transporter permease [Acidimicrobiia bacterium]|jgi:branched-chain amino acid transport system permease protein
MADAIAQGVLLGGFYALLAAGLTLVFGVMKVVNLAHGDLTVLASYVALVLIGITGLNPLALMPVVALIMGLIGYALQRGVINFTLGQGLLPPLVVTFGISIIIQNGLLELFTADSQGLDAGPIELASIDIGPVTVGWFPLLTFALAVVVLAALHLLLRHTGLGRAFRALSDDLPTAQLMGISTRHLFAMSMGVAMMVMGVAGVILGIRAQVVPSIGPSFLIYAFESVIIGGLGSLWGTLAGGVVLGVAQNVGAFFDPGWSELAGHLVFLAILAFRPRGLFGRPEAL